MKRSVVVYDSSWRKTRYEVVVSASKTVRLVWGFLRGVGSGLIVAALAGLIITWTPILKEEISFRLGLNRLKEKPTGFAALIERAEAERVAAVQKEAAELGVPNADFSIVIPKIGATSGVIANVNPADESEYLDALAKGVAHARGTVFPGYGKGTIYLFAHSTDAPFNVSRYNAVFYLLRKLDKGDKIIIFFANKKYVYRVSEKVIADPDDISWLTQAQGEETLILQTCDPPGTTLRRLLVVAQPSRY